MRVFAIIFLILGQLTTSKHIVCQMHQSFKRNSVFAEASSRRPVYSLNYDRVFYHGDKIFLSYRVGVHILNDELGVPLGISLLTNHNTNSHFELSLVLMPYIDRVNYLFREGNYSDKYIYLTPGVGYRYQRAQGGLFLKALVAPQVVLDPRSDNFWAMDPRVYGIVSVGAGYSF